MDFFANILIFIGIVWLVGWAVRMLFRWWLARKVSEFNRAAGGAGQGTQGRGTWGTGGARGNAGGTQNRSRGGRKEGEVRVDGADPAATKKVNREVGEYVDFEEVKDND